MSNAPPAEIQALIDAHIGAVNTRTPSCFFSVFGNTAVVIDGIEAAALQPWRDAALVERWARLIEVRDTVNAALEVKRQDKTIGTSLGARVRIKAGGEVAELLESAINRRVEREGLKKVNDQRGLVYRGSNARPYRWIRALTTYGVLLPDIDRLWTAWWSVGTIGRAVASVQYISALMYPSEANSVFAPWTRDEGGGPPCLWEFERTGFNHTHSAIFAFVSPWPHRPLLASGRLANGHSWISSPLNFLNSCARVTGVKPLRVLAA